MFLGIFAIGEGEGRKVRAILARGIREGCVGVVGVGVRLLRIFLYIFLLVCILSTYFYTFAPDRRRRIDLDEAVKSTLLYKVLEAVGEV